jgi:arginyl-tRNA synthetase
MFREPVMAALKILQAQGILPNELSFDGVVVEPPKDPTHGDVSTNAPLVLAKKAHLKPRDLAEQVCLLLAENPHVLEATIAGAGFINLRLKPSYWHRMLQDLLSRPDAYGASTLGGGQRVNIEYVSANPTGPLHAGHGRCAVVADVIANLLEKVGFEVTREYYINDTGGQIDVLARSMRLRYLEALGQEIGDIPPGYYPGIYLKEVAEEALKALGARLLEAPETEVLDTLGTFALNKLMDDIFQDLKAIGIDQDVFTSELSLRPEVARSVEKLETMGLVYEGILEKPKSVTEDDWEPTPLMLFRSTQFGDSADRPLKKSTGDWTYFAGDVAYHMDKIGRKFDHLVNVFGADHASHVDRLKAAVTALSGGEVSLEIILAQMVHFVRGGEPLKMSKRTGTFVTVRDIVDQIGPDVFRFLMVSRKHDSQFTLDLDQACEQSKENPVFYVQYAHARTCSLLRHAPQLFPGLVASPESFGQAALDLLTDEAEMTVLKALAEWPDQVEGAAKAREPHRITTYLHHLAHTFHTLWNKGNQDTVMRVLVPGERALSEARLALVQGVQVVLASGLNLLGVTPCQELR